MDEQRFHERSFCWQDLVYDNYDVLEISRISGKY